MTVRRGGATPVRVQVLEPARRAARDDVVVTEEPLEIRLASARGEARTVAVTMRTPGADFELAAGFLRTEAVVGGRSAVRRIVYCLDAGDQRYNVVTVHLAGPELPELGGLDRYGSVSSACGVCGKTSLDALEVRAAALPAGRPTIEAGVLHALPDALRHAQRTFSLTGGLHAAGLFTPAGEPLVVREDVGRHNAVDKVVGWALLKDVAVDSAVLVVSGRAGFEIVQKAVAARIPVVCAVSAPSSLAVDTATRFGLTLVGFLRDQRANVYSGADRIR
ncbi:MAG: formate dehydrogenase accessory sulfurtransferase FdhD [Acidimicrobiia bacterium]